MGHMSSTPARVRMSPDSRREQLIELGVRLLATRSLEDLSIETLAEEAGISRGLLYHYFGGKQEFHTAVVRRAADDLFAVTAPDGEGTRARAARGVAGPLRRLRRGELRGLRLAGPRCGGRPRGPPGDLRGVPRGAHRAGSSRARRRGGRRTSGWSTRPPSACVVRGWAALTEEVVLDWVRDDRGISREELLVTLPASLPGILAPLRRAR